MGLLPIAATILIIVKCYFLVIVFNDIDQPVWGFESFKGYMANSVSGRSPDRPRQLESTYGIKAAI